MNPISSVLDRILSSISSFNFLSDLLDIIVVAVVIYEGIRLLRNSRSFELLKTIVFLGLVYVAVKLMNMEASEFILTTLFKNGLLILVVLFAPEIRKLLERLGRSSLGEMLPFLRNNSAGYEKNITDTINGFCKAASDMSETKTGALVVFEKKDLLNDVISTGVVIDAKSSSELFKSLFFKNSALHDGAVVVRDGKVYSAGCILPLTQNVSLASDLGTRHRAAIGMSEQSDAVVVVVSEERGSISVARNGKLSRDISSAALREMLLGELVDTKDSNPPKSDFHQKHKGEIKDENAKS